MKLFYKSGACSMAAHILLNEVKATYALEKVDTDKGEMESGGAYAQINPRGYVPALKFDNGSILTENVAILSWLSDTYPELSAANANDPLQKFRMLETLSFLNSELHKAFGPYFSGKTFSDEQTAQNLKALKAKISQFEAMLPKDGAYLLGGSFSVADAYAFVILNWAGFLDIPLTEWPRTEQYVARIKDRPATQRALQEEGLAA